MKMNRKYRLMPLIFMIILAGLYWTSNPWIWLAITVICAILPGTSGSLRGWKFIHYFVCALVAMGSYYFTAPPETAVLEAMGELVKLGESGYVIAVILVSALAFAMITLTFRSILVWFAESRNE